MTRMVHGIADGVPRDLATPMLLLRLLLPVNSTEILLALVIPSALAANTVGIYHVGMTLLARHHNLLR